MLNDAADDRPYLVVTGSSAGGIDALVAFVAGLPATFPAPIVIAQHLAPTHESRLVEIIQRKTILTVHVVEDRQELFPGTIYIAGPDCDVEIVDDRASVTAVVRKGPKPSIDGLFASAAQANGERTIAIVFSGKGSDGVAGAQAVKQHGGTVVTQTASSASFPAMPLAVPPTLVDLSGRPEDLGGMLTELIRHGASPDATRLAVLRSLLAQLRNRSGIDFAQYKMPTIMRRLSRLMVAGRVDSIAAYLEFLEAHPENYARLTGAFLIQVTEFFRDDALFETLRTVTLPRLIAEARANGNELRIWSAGTSTGEEAYSLAVMCAELLEGEAEPPAVRIFATDIDEGAIAFARRGIYPAQSLKNVPAAWRERYFERVGDTYEVAKRLRAMTVFGQHDLGQRAPFPRIDLCLCRNVLIYFTRELQTRALQLFAFSLRSGGFLVLGKAETSGALSDFFRTVDATAKIFQRQGERILIPPVRMRLALPSEAASPRRPAFVRRPADMRATESGPLADETRLMYGGAPIGIVAVDRRYDILALNGVARALLEVHGVGVGDDLIHLVRNIDGVQLRSLVDAAFRGEAVPAHEFPVFEPSGDVKRWFLVSTTYDEASPGTPAETVTLFIIEITANVAPRRDLEIRTREQELRLSDLERRLDETARRQTSLLQANAELSDANTRLRNANEELLIEAEEAASANEEIETLSEEMQATNEELETLNEELQATIEELNTTNDELEARGDELLALANDRERAVGRLEAICAHLVGTLGRDGDAAAVLDADGIALFVSPMLGDGALAALPPGWRHGDRASIGGTEYALTHRTPLDGVSVITFQRLGT